MSRRILVVNDTQEILELFREILEEEGFEAVLYSFAINDMREIERIQPDLIILDYVFGGERAGWQMLQKLKMRRTTAMIPIIICTAAIREVREIEGYLQAQGITVVAKPFNLDDLYYAIRVALKAPSHDASLVDRTNGGDNGGDDVAGD
ncbi:MAG TPA: response regulator [Ktedonobacterales bacterium]|jgi:DNA-binding response OmpR family regulator